MDIKRTIPIFLAVLILSLGVAGCAVPEASPVDAAVENLHWFGSLSVLYHGSQNVYFDPVGLRGDPPPADLILISHAHGETWSLPDVLEIIRPDTTLIISPNMVTTYELYADELGVQAIVLNEGESTTVDGVTVEAVHVNQNPQHLGAEGIVGYLVTVDGVRIYAAGETLFYPEMAGIQSDITLYPVFSEAPEDIDQVVRVLQTEVMIFVRTPLSMAQIYMDRYNQEGLPIEFIIPSNGEYVP